MIGAMCELSLQLKPEQCSDVTGGAMIIPIILGWQNLNLQSHPNATLAPQARQARASGENLNYMTLAPQARKARPRGEILNYMLSHYLF